MTDLVYILKGTQENEELRYSLRSMEANLPHDRVWIVGPKRPRFLTGAELIKSAPGRTKWENLPLAILAASAHPEVSAQYILCNDDFFVMSPFDEMPVLHRGLVIETGGYKKSSGTYGRGYHETERHLRGMGVEGDLLNYELHVPLPVDKDRMAEVLRVRGFRGRCLHTRTLYGNRWKIGGEQMADVKIHRKVGNLDRPFLSTNDYSFEREAVGKFIRAAFPQPSQYEKE